MRGCAPTTRGGKLTSESVSREAVDGGRAGSTHDISLFIVLFSQI